MTSTSERIDSVSDLVRYEDGHVLRLWSPDRELLLFCGISRDPDPKLRFENRLRKEDFGQRRTLGGKTFHVGGYGGAAEVILWDGDDYKVTANVDTDKPANP